MQTLIKTLILTSTFITSIFATEPSPTGNITLNISKISANKGEIKAALYQKGPWLEKNGNLMGVSGPADTSGVTLTFENVPYGEYGIAIYHDKNSNKKFDMNFMGIPKEPYAFSNNTKAKFKAPAFKSAAFRLDQPALTQEISF